MHTTITLLLALLTFFSSYNIVTAKEKKYNVEITWYGHSVVTLYDGKTRILIDPFFTGNSMSPITWDKLPKIDYILLTHDHGDHVGDTIAIAKKFGAKVTGIVETMEALEKAGLPKDLVLNGIGFNIGGTVSLGTFKALMIPAMHTSTTGIPVGYFVTSSSGFRTYHSGDTAPFGDMKLWASFYPINLAILPIGGYFTQDAFLAVKSVELLKPNFVLPMHYKTFPILASSTDEFKALLEKSGVKTKLLLTKPGQTIQF